MCCSWPHRALWCAVEAAGGWLCWGRELKQNGEPCPLTSLLPLVSGVPDPGQRTPLCHVPAPLQDPSGNPSAELSGTLLLPHWGVSKLWGWCKESFRAREELCHFIEERWYREQSTSAAAGGHTQPLVDLGASWHRIWRGMAGILHYRVGEAEVVGDGRERDLRSDPAYSPLSAC